MHVVAKDEAGPGEQRVRFSPLKMVARALAGRQGPVAGNEAGSCEVAPPGALQSAPVVVPVAPPPAYRASGESMLAIVNALLAADDDAWLEPDDTEFDLTDVVRDALDAFCPDAEAKGVALALATAPGAPGRYRGDLPRLRQVLLNLVAGALQATTEDTLVFAAAWEDGMLTLRLADAEAADAMSRVLVDLAPRRPRRGATRRLAASHAAALTFGGAVRAIADDGVELTVPLKRLADARPASPRQESAAAATPPEPAFEPGLRVLVAEESPPQRQMLIALLAGMGLEAVGVGDGEEAVGAWRQESWDALLIDIDGEAVGGRNLARSIRAAEAVARWPRTPMLALAAHVDARDLDDDLAALIDGLVAKPVSAASLHLAISSALDADRTAAPAPRASVG